MGSVIIIILLLGILFVLIGGIFLMGKGGEANKKYGNKLMSARVALQGLILVVLIVMFLASSK